MANRTDFNAPMIRAVQTQGKALPERVADMITQLIVDDAYRPGARLPNEFILAKRLGVGRSTVREAIKILVSKHILEVQHGSGTFVCERTGMVDDPLGFSFFRDKKRLAIDLCEVRMMLEPQIAAAAARNINPDQIETLQAVCDEAAEQFRAGTDHSKKDIEFHARIAEASGNLIAPRVVAIISTTIPMFITMAERDLREASIRAHQKIVDAIRKRQPVQASRAMSEHLEHNWNIFKAQPENS